MCARTRSSLRAAFSGRVGWKRSRAQIFPVRGSEGVSGRLERGRALFGVDGLNLCLSFVLVLGGGVFLGRVLMVFHCHCGFETAYAVSDSFAEFGKLFGSEYEQSDPKNYQEMHGLKESFEHYVDLAFKMFVADTVDRGIQGAAAEFPYAAPRGREWSAIRAPPNRLRSPEFA